MNDIRNNNDDKLQSLQKHLSTIDLRHETNWLRKVAEKENYPVVFCHNDLQEGNILFRQHGFVPQGLAETLDEELSNLEDLSPMLISCPKTAIKSNESVCKHDAINGNSRKRSFDNGNAAEPELMIIDFEYCAYNYRAFDIANHFLEWTYDYTNNQFPFFHHRPSAYPTSEQIDNFITIYLSSVGCDGAKKIVPTDEQKKQLLEEIALFTLASHLFWSTWAIVNIHQEIEFGYWEYAEIRLCEYFKAKAKYFDLKPESKDVYSC
jgi:choline/ethanolamine kinase